MGPKVGISTKKSHFWVRCFGRNWLNRSQAEAVLWTNWKHRGTLTAVSDVKLAMLDAQGFFDLCQRFMRRSEAALKILGYLVKT